MAGGTATITKVLAPVLPDCPADARKRVQVELLANQSKQARDMILERCRKDPEWFIDFFCWTYDPRPTASQPELPFFLYDFQRELVQTSVEHIREGKDLLIEKSRDMGVTWILLCIFSHHWLFKPRFNALLGSRKEDYVDNRTMDSHFGRIEFILKKLPGWMLPEGFNFNKHRQWMKLHNPELECWLVGESSNAEFSSGGRFNVIFLDEASKWDEFASVWRATAQATTCRIGNSTPNGMNAWGRLMTDSDLRITKRSYHWSLHPQKDKQWYEDQKARMSDVDIAQELDISYSRSVHGVVYPGWADVPKGEYPFENGWPLFVGIDFGIADPTSLVWAQRNPADGRVRIIDCFEKNGKPADFFIPFITGEIPTGSPYHYSNEELEKIAYHSIWGVPIVYGDPAGKQRAQSTGDSVIDIYRKHGVYIVTRDDARDFKSRFRATQLMLRHCEVHIETCGKLNEAMLNARFQERSEDTPRTSTIEKPVHNWSAHLRSALEYLCVNLPQRRLRGRPQPTRRKLAYMDL